MADLSLDVSNAKGALTGDRFIESLRDGREVWLDGERVQDVTKHPAFTGAIREFARIYDLQHDPAFKDRMTFDSYFSGKKVSRSWQLPNTAAEMREKADNTWVWMEQSWGQLGRTPDFMAGVLNGWVNIKDQLAAVRPMFGENVVNYHRFCMEHDISLTHAIGDPQINRADVFHNPLDEPDMALRVVEEKSEGVILRGAKQLATLAPISNEILVYLSATFSRRAKDEFVQWFGIPMNTPGLKIICREPLSVPATGHAYPFAARYDEQDAMVFFDDVLVPWERIFMLYDREAAVRLMGAAGFGRGVNSTMIRYYNRLLTYVGTTLLIADAIGVDGFPEVREKLGELAMYAEIQRLSLVAQQADAELRLEHQQAGTDFTNPYSPGGGGLQNWTAMTSQRVAQILREVGGSGLLMQPSDKDLASADLRPYLDRYMRGAGVDVEYKSRLYRLGADLTLSTFSNRQELYEYWHGGDPTRNRTNVFLRHDRSWLTERVHHLLQEIGDAAGN